MEQKNFVAIIQDLTEKALWEVKNVIIAVPDELWNSCYCDMPMWKHIYHTLHSLDLWFMNPRDKNFPEPWIHEKDLNNLDNIISKTLSRDEINQYICDISSKISTYVSNLRDEELLSKPDNCEYIKFTLILAQFRHLHTHLGMIMGFIICDTGKWPRVLGLENPIPNGSYNIYF